MITKAIILERVMNTNTYSVRVPFLDGSIREVGRRIATVSSDPAISEEYRTDDVVYVSFEDHKPDKIVIIGKLYVGDNEPRGLASFESLNVKSSANLPLNTIFGSTMMSDIINRIENLPEIIGSNVTQTPIVNFSRNLITNINNISVIGYRLEELPDNEGYIIQTSNSQKLNEQLAKKYLLTIMGSAYLPKYDDTTQEHPNIYSYVICVNEGIVYRYEYTSDRGLLAWLTSDITGGAYLPLSGGTLTGDLNFKKQQGATNKAIIHYEDEQNQHSDLSIKNLSGDIHIKSKYDPTDEEGTGEYGTYIDDVLIKVLSEDEIQAILNNTD